MRRAAPLHCTSATYPAPLESVVRERDAKNKSATAVRWIENKTQTAAVENFNARPGLTVKESIVGEIGFTGIQRWKEGDSANDGPQRRNGGSQSNREMDITGRGASKSNDLFRSNKQVHLLA